MAKAPHLDLGPLAYDDPNVPPEKIDGKPNPAHWQYLYHKSVRLAFNAATSGDKSAFNYKNLGEMILTSAELQGFNRKSVMDQRSDADKIRDTIESLMAAPRKMWEELDADLDLATSEVKRTIDWTDEEIRRLRGLNDLTLDQERELEERRERGKEFVARAEKILRFRALIRNECPNGLADLSGHRIPTKKLPAWEAANLLLYMIYVQRTNEPEFWRKVGDVASPVLRMGDHHAKMAVAIWLAKFGIVLKPEKIHRGAMEFMGVVLVCAPGHGKSELAVAFASLWISRRPDTQSLYLHAKEDMASESLTYVASMFKDTSEAGRRRNALFPGLTLADDSAKKFRLHLPGRMKSPTMKASGVSAAGLGGNASLQIHDDIVPQSDAEQPTERERRKKLMGSTWGSRARGKGFKLIIGTIWHPQDYLASLVSAARAEKGAYLVRVQRCGGPTSSPQFFPLWPEVWPARRLRQRYESDIKDPVLWSCAYEANPISEASRPVKRLRFYDPESEEHEAFLQSAQFHISVDPSATGNETSDKTGFVYAARGEIEIETNSGSRTFENRLRIIDAKEEHMSQLALGDFIMEYAHDRTTHMVHIETGLLGHATIDHMRNQGLNLNVQQAKTNSKSKGQRLKAVAFLLDDGNPGSHAIVEFPGKKTVEDGVEKIVENPEHPAYFLCREILDFPMGSDHCFPAETIVATKRGPVPICEVVAGDMVVTRRGYRRVLRAWCTGEKEVITRFGITSTPEHRVWTTGRGWMPLTRVCDSDTLVRCTNHRSLSSSTDWSIDDSLCPSVGATEFTTADTQTGKRPRSGYTGTYGSSTTGRYPAVGLCTTKTATHSTTTFPISNSTDHSRNTPRSIQKRLARDSAPQNSSGIWRIYAEAAGKKHLVAPSASDLSRRLERDTRNTASHAGRLSVGKLREHGEPLTRNWLDSVPENPRAGGRQNVVPVWDLMVEDEHEFFADGVLVHNCLDAFTQLSLYLSRNQELVAGSGPVTEVVRRIYAERMDKVRVRQHLAAMLSKNVNPSQDRRDEREWLNTRWTTEPSWS